MKIILAGATNQELQPIVESLNSTMYTRSAHHIEFLHTGVGMVAATFAITNTIQVHAPDLVIQAGIAGSFQEDRIGQVLAIWADLIADQGVVEQSHLKSVFDLGLEKKDTPPYEEGWLINPYQKLLSLSSLEPVRSVTVNMITSDINARAMYEQKYAAVVESMEGAALHYACLMLKVPFIQIRGISNRVADRDKSNWEISTAIQNMSICMLSFIQKLLNSADETYFRI